MKIPEPNQAVELKLKSGERITAIIHSINPIQPGIHRMWLLVQREIPKGEHLSLLTEEGSFPLAVHETRTHDGDLLIELRAYEGAVPEA